MFYSRMPVLVPLEQRSRMVLDLEKPVSLISRHIVSNHKPQSCMAEVSRLFLRGVRGQLHLSEFLGTPSLPLPGGPGKWSFP